MGLFGNKQKALGERVTRDVSQSMQALVKPLITAGWMINALEADPFVAGYFQAKTMELILGFGREVGLDRDQINTASGMVLINTFGNDAHAISDTIKRHSAAKSQAFLEGIAKGQLIVAYMMGAKDPKSDPAYAAAKARAEAATAQEATLYGNASVSADVAIVLTLEQMYFSDRVAKAG